MDPAIFIGLVINLVLSFVVANMAAEKGRSYAGFFWLSFLLSFFIGLLIVLASQPIAKNQGQNVDPRMLVKCQMCAEPILAEARVCKHCGRDVEPQFSVIEGIAQEETAKAVERESRNISAVRSQSIVGAVIMLLFAAGLFTIVISALSLSLSNSKAVATVSILSVLGAVLVLLSIVVLRRMPSKQKSMHKEFKSK